MKTIQWNIENIVALTIKHLQINQISALIIYKELICR